MKAANPTGLGCACGCVRRAVLCGDPAPPRTARAVQGARPEAEGPVPHRLDKESRQIQPCRLPALCVPGVSGKDCSTDQLSARSPPTARAGHTTGPDCCPQASSPSSKYRARALNWPSSGQQGQSLATWQHNHTDLCRDSVGTMQVTLPETYHHQINR